MVLAKRNVFLSLQLVELVCYSQKINNEIKLIGYHLDNKNVVVTDDIFWSFSLCKN